MQTNRPLLLISFVLIGFWSAHAQDRVDMSEKKIVFSGTAFTTLPFGLVKKVTNEKSARIEGLTVVRKKHELRKAVLVSSTELCGEINGTVASVADPDEFLYRVQRYVSYQFSGKTFAYEVDYEFSTRIPEKRSARQQARSMLTPWGTGRSASHARRTLTSRRCRSGFVICHDREEGVGFWLR